MDAEVESKEGSSESLQVLITQYQTLLKQQRTFQQQLLRQMSEKIYNKVDNMNVQQTIFLDQVESACAKLFQLEIGRRGQLV